MISLFRPDLEDERLKRLSFNLVNSSYLISEEYRDYDIIWKQILSLLRNGMPLYELEPWLGVVLFKDVIPGYRARLIPWVWDKSIYKMEDYLKEFPEFLDIQMKKFALHRLAVETPDEELVGWLKQFGFKIEGRQKYGFKTDEKMITQYMLRKIKEV